MWSRFLARVARTAVFAGMMAVLTLSSSAWADSPPPASPVPASASPTPAPAAAAPAPAPHAVNAYGPTTVTTAVLTNVGIPEFEQFWFESSNSPGYTSLRQAPFLVKYTFNPRWMVNLGGSSWLSQTTPTGTTRAFGDLTPGIKYLIAVPRNAKMSTQALQLQVGVPTSNPALGFTSGHTQEQLTWFYSQDYGKAHLDVNLWLTDLTAPDGVRHLQFGQGVGLTVPVNKAGNLLFEGEVHRFGSAGPALPQASYAMGVLYWSVAPQCTLAGGVQLGLGSSAVRQTFIVGVVFLVDGVRK